MAWLTEEAIMQYWIMSAAGNFAAQVDIFVDECTVYAGWNKERKDKENVSLILMPSSIRLGKMPTSYVKNFTILYCNALL